MQITDLRHGRAHAVVQRCVAVGEQAVEFADQFLAHVPGAASAQFVDIALTAEDHHVDLVVRVEPVDKVDRTGDRVLDLAAFHASGDVQQEHDGGLFLRLVEDVLHRGGNISRGAL